MIQFISTPAVWYVIPEGSRARWNLRRLRPVWFAGLVCLAGSTAVAVENYDSALAKQAGSPYEGEVGQAQATAGGAETLYGTDVTDDNLLIIDKLTAESVIAGPVGTPVAAGLAFDPQTGLLFATDSLTGNLVTIDRADGTTTVIGNTGISFPHGLAIDPDDGTLYATDASSLHVIDRNTGAADFIGFIGFSFISGLDFDPETGVLYGGTGGPDSVGLLVTIDTNTGLGTLVGLTHRVNGLAFDNDGALYASENGLSSGVPSALYQIDKRTGDWQLIGEIDADNVLGIDFTVEAPPIPALSAGGALLLGLILATTMGLLMLRWFKTYPSP